MKQNNKYFLNFYYWSSHQGDTETSAAVGHFSMELVEKLNGDILYKNYLSVWPEWMGYKLIREPIKLMDDISMDVKAEEKNPDIKFSFTIDKNQYQKAKVYTENFKDNVKNHKVDYLLFDNLAGVGSIIKEPVD